MIWGGRVFVTSVEGARKETLGLLAFDQHNGRELWQREWTSSFPEQDSDYISKAAPTPAVDDERVYVLFESGDLFALSHEGQEIWHRALTRDFGPFSGNHGQGSSPLLAQDTVVLLMDHQGPSFIAAFDRAAGTTRWKTDRSTTSAWSSPVLVDRHGRSEIVASASGSVIAYDPTDGSVRWSHEGLEANNVPSPSADGAIVLVGSRRKGANLALRVSADDTTTVAWTSILETVFTAMRSPGIAWYSVSAVVCCALPGQPPCRKPRLHQVKPCAIAQSVKIPQYYSTHSAPRNPRETVLLPNRQFKACLLPVSAQHRARRYVPRN